MKKQSVIAIIPARYGSTRFPGKPLALIQGKTLIQRTYENTKKCSLLDELVVATDDQRIYDHVKEFGGNVVMTPIDCPTGSDRLAFVLQQNPAWQKAELIVNIQGDDPCLDPEVTQKIIEVLRHDSEAVMSTAIVKIDSEEDILNPNVVKCVIDLQGNALYFSRSLIPGNFSMHVKKSVTYYKHIGTYAYRPQFLLQYVNLSMTPLQIAEDLEQLKVLEHGYKIKAAVVNRDCPGVNVPEDIKKVEQELCRQNSYL
jgi:3-deoxy-manno-octulosonate cytidylyltransferase (CMP-KDO synthetase)